MKNGSLYVLLMVLAVIGAIVVDQLYISKFGQQFKDLEKKRIVVSNKLATAKIVHENLNHVRDLVFKNMDFQGTDDSLSHETILFNFLTTCVNDLKMKLVSVKPQRPYVLGRMTVHTYEIQLEGDFFSFGELCSKFENSRRIINLIDFHVELLDKGSRFGRKRAKKMGSKKGVSVSLTVKTYKVKKAAK